MKFIKLTNIYQKMRPIDVHINIEMIGSISLENHEGNICTKVTCLTHNNGGFKVKETPEEIFKLINQLN
jgi:hypothetical protein